MVGKQKRRSIEDIRRIELIQAAHRVFMTHGLGGMTTARICEEAGMSPGILAYYFKGKDEVLFGMVRYNNRILMEEVVARLSKARNRWERLTAIIEGNFPARNYDRNAANAWLSVVAAATSEKKYERLQAIFYKRLKSNMASALSGVLPPQRLEAAVLSTSIMIDGLWVRKAAGSDISHSAAKELVLFQLRSFLLPEELSLLQTG
ncbi:MAG: transcriptional regulator BetI [Rhizobiaceae bacterium]